MQDRWLEGVCPALGPWPAGAGEGRGLGKLLQSPCLHPSGGGSSGLGSRPWS